MINNFADLGISNEFESTLLGRNINIPTSIQTLVIPELLNGHNVFFEAPTGSGKTLAYLLPSLSKLKNKDNKVKANPEVLIISPTIELSSQIKKEIQSLSDKVKSFLAVGGSKLSRQLDGLKQKPQIIIGNPARISNLITLSKLKINNIHTVIFDEADRLMAKENMTFINDIISVLTHENIQYIACSATFSNSTGKILDKLILKNIPSFEYIYRKVNNTEVLKNAISHWAIFSEQEEKVETLKKFIKAVPEAAKFLVFTSPAKNVEPFCKKLNWKKVEADALYTNLKNQDRQRIIDGFRSGKIKVLVTSDLAARGLDIPNVDYVIHMNVPKQVDFYIHRAGRTGRAGNNGVSVCIGDEYEMHRLKDIEQELGLIVYPKKVYGGKILQES